MKSISCLLFILVTLPLWGQKNPIMGTRDTLTNSFMTGGPIDSVDISFSYHSSTQVGGGFGATENVQPYNLFVRHEGGDIFRNFEDWKKMRFSAMPHLGFGYIFGAQATQIVKTNYTHAFNYNNLLNIDYDMQRGNAFIRNSDFGKHDVQLRYQLTSNFYSLDLKGQFLTKNINQNDGITNDSLIALNGLALTPVRKENAMSKYRGVRAHFNHYFDFLAKDTTNAMGLYVENQLNILNRKYTEYADSLILIYPEVNLDNDSTGDQYQLSQLINGAGLYYNRTGFYLKAGLLYNYWQYANLGHLRKQSEINLDGKLGIMIKGVFIENHTNLNLIGAKGEWFTNTKASYQFRDFHVGAKARISMQLPEQFQRFYFANNISYDTPLSDLKQQFRMDINGNINYSKGLHGLGVFAKNAVVTNNYWYYNNQWTNDTLTTLNALSIGFSGKTGYKILRFAASGSYNASNWMPDFLFQGRLYIQGRMFKGKKLLGQFGVESSYHTGYRLLEHVPMMDVFRLSSMSTATMVNLHVFAAFQVTRFRFFFRVENIGSFWTDKTYRVNLNQPIPAMQIRVGITWDFFN